MEACFHLLDFHYLEAAVFSSSVLCAYALLLHVLSEVMLSSSLAEVPPPLLHLLLPRVWKRL